MGQKKVHRTLEWHKQQLHINTMEHVKHLHKKWLEKHKETLKNEKDHN